MWSGTFFLEERKIFIRNNTNMNWYRRAKITDQEIQELYKAREWKSVDSSFISEIDYHEKLFILDVKLKNGRTYSYRDVPKRVYNAFLNSDSKGEFFNKNIKKKYKLIPN